LTRRKEHAKIRKEVLQKVALKVRRTGVKRGFVSQRAKNDSELKETNLLRVFFCLKEASPLTKNDLCSRLNLSRPTVDRAIAQLTEHGLVKRDGRSPSGGGRRAVLYKLNERARYAVGGDLELPELNLTLCGLNGIPSASKGFTVPDNRVADPGKALEYVSDSIRSFVNEEGVPFTRILGIGIGIPAFLKGDTITISGRNLPRWVRVPAKAILEQQLNLPVFIDNDVKFMALAENHTLGYRDKMTAYVALRKGLKGDIRMGGCLLLDGEVFPGGSGNAASLQHAYVEAEKLERFLQPGSAPSVSREMAALVADSLIQPIMHMVMLCDPNRLVINAAILEQAEEAFVEEIATRLTDKLKSEFDWEIKVNMAQDRRFGCAKGGALFVLQKVFSRPAALFERLIPSPHS